MKNILFLQSSILGDNSQTNRVANALRAELAQRRPEDLHVVRDLALTPLPHLQAEHLGQPPQEGAQALAELKACDVLVVCAPMYNFGIPSSLKAWLDHVLKAGETFRYTESGPQGLLSGKRALLVVGTGGVYSEGAYKPYDFVEPYLRAALGFIGITEVFVVRAEGSAVTAEAGRLSAQAAEQAAKAWAQSL